MRRRVAVAVCSVATVLCLVGSAGTAQAAPLPVGWNWLGGYLPALIDANTPPPGAENLQAPGSTTKCDVAASRTKRPLILVHGTSEHQRNNWMAMSPFFKNAGFCVYTLNYGGNPGDISWGYKSVADSAGELATYVDTVLAATGASKVDIVGHSQGGMMPRAYTKFLGGADKVHTLVGLSASNNGTTLSGLADLGATLGILPAIASVAPAAIDQTIGSPFMKQLNSCPGTSRPYNVCIGDPVKYVSLQVNGDQVITPYQNAFLTHEPGAKEPINVLVNDICGLEFAEHLGMSYSRNVAQLALRALDPTVTENACVLSLPYLGGG